MKKLMVKKSSHRATQHVKQVIDILDKLLEKGDWQASLFLRTAEKDLKALREQGLNLLTEEEQTEQTVNHHQHLLDNNKLKVFILLYQVRNQPQRQWQQAVNALVGHAISRPIYSDEPSVNEVLRAKKDKRTYAYATVYVDKEDVLEPLSGNPKQDAAGHPLLTLREDAVKLENIVEFIYQERRYQCIEGKIMGFYPEE